MLSYRPITEASPGPRGRKSRKDEKISDGQFTTAGIATFLSMAQQPSAEEYHGVVNNMQIPGYYHPNQFLRK